MRTLTLALFGLALICAPAYAQMISGKVQAVNSESNTLEILPNDQSKICKLTWKEDLDGSQKLENAQVGDEIAVEANKGFFSRKYHVKAVNPEDIAAANFDDGRAIGDTTPKPSTLAQNAGQSLKDAGETVGAGVNRAASKVGDVFDRDNANEAADKLEDTADDAGDSIRRSARDAQDTAADKADDAGDAIDKRF